MSTKKRVDTMRILVSSHASLHHSPKLSDIVGELNRVESVAKVPKHNGWLLSILHTTRALDTALREVLKHKSWLPAKEHSLGGYLKALETHNIVTPSERSNWTRLIVNRRNRYMHSAGAMPNQFETDIVLSEMQACLTVVLAKT